MVKQPKVKRHWVKQPRVKGLMVKNGTNGKITKWNTTWGQKV